jgi:PAS domain S-box-containing protein
LARPAAIGLRFPRERIDAVLDQAAGLRGGGLAEGWTAAIIDRAGVPVARVPGGAGPVGQPSAPQSLAGLAGSADGLVRGRMTPEGVPTIAAVARGERSGYRYLLAMPLAEFTAPLDRALLRTLLAGAVVVAIGLGLSALLAHRTVEAFRAVRGAASGRAQPGATALREAEELAHAIAEAAADRNRVEAALVASERRNREVLESLGERLFALDGEGRVRFASRAALEGWNTAADDLLHRRFEEVFPAAVGSVTWEAVRTALVGREEVHLCGRSPLLERWVEVDAYPSADGGLVVAFRDIDDLRHAYRDRAQATEALRGSEERLRFALEAAELGSWEVDLRAGVVRRSPRALEVFGFGPEAAEDRYPSWRGRMHPEDRAGAVGAIEAAVAGRIEAYRVEYRHQRPDGRWIWVESHGRVVARDPATGAATRLAGTSRDVTERRAAEERQALLAREVDHRAKNALAVVQAAVRLTPKADPAGFARAIEGRVNALARAQTLLAADRWSSADLRSLIEGELAPFLAAGEDRPAAVLSGPRVALPAEATQPIAMAVHELATNAVKHGALSRRGGQVLVYWTLDTDRDPAQLELRWVERGGPPVSGDPERRGFGSRVLDGTVRRQLGGRVELEWDASGLVCRITVPLRSPATARRRAGERLEAVE